MSEPNSAEHFLFPIMRHLSITSHNSSVAGHKFAALLIKIKIKLT